ncbi:auxilin-related protein [Salix suchowensis]|nr:auxilin-related protein [Salix suchowensis]
MDDFTGLLARDFGFKPQGKSAPMAPPRRTNNYSSNFNLGSGGPVHTRSSSSSNKTAPLFDNHAGTDGALFNDVFGGPPQYSVSRGGTSTTALSFDHDSIFKEQNSKSASLPIFDKPVYDDDIFDGLPGLKSSSSGGGSASVPKFDDAFRSVSSPPKQQQHGRPVRDSSPFDDLLGNLGKKETDSKRERGRVDKDSAAFDDLLPGFGRPSSPAVNRSTSEPGRFEKLSSNSAWSVPGVKEDPIIVLESTSSPATSSSGLFTEPLGEISKISNPGSMKVDSSSVDRGVFEDLDHLNDLGKSVPYKRQENRSPLRTGPSTGVSYSSVSQESVDTYPVKNAGGRWQKKTTGDYQESHEAIFDMPTTEIHRSYRQNASPPSYVDVNANETNSSPRSEEVSESSDGVWLSVSEIPLFTQPTSTPPPSRPPPPRPPRISKSEMGSFSSTNSRKKVNEYPSFQNSTSYSQSPRSDRAARNSVTSQIYELEDFVTGRTRNNNNEFQNNLPVDDVDKTSSAAASAAMKEAMDKAEAKFRQMREREYLKAARNKETGQVDKVMQDAQQRELKEREERFYRERQQREKEEEERDQRRFEKERERAREIERERGGKEREQRRLERERERAREMERERDKAKQVVERATREARERAATEALLKAERAAVEKAAAQARERAERTAVQRAQAEARERAAAEAKERAERAAAEARERENAEAREREARERVAVERAAAEARERAATAARANHQKSENDLESFFSTRANSAPRPRTNTSDPFSDSQNNRGSEAVRKMSAGASSSMRKASTINIVDDFTSLFGGGAGSSGEFQEVEGETEERRKARLERHQRTQERAAKAVAEKNHRDLLAQREQAERHRIAETLDVEIKRWAAGKEGNLRALLSTLQYVLWPECGWQPVSLTDLITAAAVKKVYRKATLSIHPDKVQQKGANLQQKYVAEKVFDLLKEAWNKFNSEELF